MERREEEVEETVEKEKMTEEEEEVVVKEEDVDQVGECFLKFKSPRTTEYRYLTLQELVMEAAEPSTSSADAQPGQASTE